MASPGRFLEADPLVAALGLEELLLLLIVISISCWWFSDEAFISDFILLEELTFSQLLLLRSKLMTISKHFKLLINSR